MQNEKEGKGEAEEIKRKTVKWGHKSRRALRERKREELKGTNKQNHQMYKEINRYAHTKNCLTDGYRSMLN